MLVLFRRSRISGPAILGLLAGVACSDRNPVAVSTTQPQVLSAAPNSAPDNVLSARIVFTAQAGDSVHVSYWTASSPLTTTPSVVARSGADTVVLLGLAPGTTYECRVEGNEGMLPSRVTTFQTGNLPPELQTATMARISGTPSTMAMTGINGRGDYAVVFDTSGAVAWYHDFTARGKPVTNVVRQRNGNITAFLGSSSGFTPTDGYYVEVTPDGREVAEYHAPAGSYMDTHELVLVGSGDQKKAIFFTYTIRTLDLSSIGGQGNVATAGHQIVREDASGAVEFRWDAWDHIALDEWTGDGYVKESRTTTDFDHPNALAFDADSNFVVSWRNLDQIMTIDARTGDIRWRLGGVHSDYTFANDPFDGFSKQHSVKVLANGNVLLFDNGGDRDPIESRAVEYQLDPASHVATMVWQFRHDPPLAAPYLGWVQRLSNGNTWVAFSYLGTVDEVTPEGTVVWEGQVRQSGAASMQYRIVPVQTVY